MIIFSSFSIFCLFGFWIRWQWNKNYQEKRKFFKIEEISVVISFRNEAENLPQLIQSLNKLLVFPREIIFVNDHSEDDYKPCFDALKVPFKTTIINLSPGDEGKKTAIRAGISDAIGECILTWDADIVVNPNYFRQLAKTPLSDLLILPVSMPGKNLKQFFFELDFQYFNALNTSISGHTKPISANGANLLFNKAIFEEIDSFDEHADVASGDDSFLLIDFKNNKKSIELALHTDLQVKTPIPDTWEAIINQRLRWIGKSKKVGDRFANYLAIFGLIYHLGFWLMFLTDATWNQLSILFYWKILLDGLLIFPYLLILKRVWLGVLIPVFSMIYPIYMLMILVMTLFYEPQWKGREI
jgi:glycosyltransferase involved in cell wall biosynthesis